MDIEKTYHKLLKLDPEESIAYEYFIKYGKQLDYVRTKIAAIANPDRSRPADFSCLEHIDDTYVQKIIDDLLKNNKSERDFFILSEDLFIQEGFNVELCNGQRYIKLFPHSHDFFELECTILGKCIHIVESHKIEMTAGDIVIVPPGVCHDVRPLPDSITVNIKVRRSTFQQTFINLLYQDSPLSEYFAKVLYGNHYKNSLAFHCGSDTFLFDLVLYMYTQQLEQKPYTNQVIEGMAVTFFSYLIQNYEHKMEFSDAERASADRMIKIEQYLRKHYRTATLSDTAAHFYLSQPYLSSYIKRHTGQSFSDILRSIRMEQACALLSAPNMKVDDVCDLVGYKDTTQFIRTFKKYYSITPKQYQKQQKTEP